MKHPGKGCPNLVLVGFMGTGKTSVGKRLAAQLRMRYVDTDHMVERKSGRQISDIFAEDGEAAFRSLEHEVVCQVSERDAQVISTGGGVVLDAANMTALKRNGTVFCLTATPEEIYKRVGHQTHRPLLQTPDPLAQIRTMLAERDPYYAEADHIIRTTGRSFSEISASIKRIYMRSIRTEE